MTVTIIVLLVVVLLMATTTLWILAKQNGIITRLKNEVRYLGIRVDTMHHRVDLLQDRIDKLPKPSNEAK